MLAISSSMNTGLLLLRQGGTAGQEKGSADQILNIVNQTKNSSVSAPKAQVDSKPKEASEGEDRSAGFRNPMLANPSKYQQLSAKEIEVFTTQQQQTMGTSDISGYARYAQDFGNEAFRGLAAKASGLNAYGAGSIFQGKVVEATTLRNATSVLWDQQVKNAEKQTSILVGGIISANAHFHKIDHIDAESKDIDPAVASILNNYIDDEMDSARMFGDLYDAFAESANSNSHGTGIAVKAQSGEYKIQAYKFMSNDEKHVVAEMREDGHFITYNEDGSVRQERNRFEVCAELSNGRGELGQRADNFGRLATLVYTEDKDLMFY